MKNAQIQKGKIQKYRNIQTAKCTTCANWLRVAVGGGGSQKLFNP